MQRWFGARADPTLRDCDAPISRTLAVPAAAISASPVKKTLRSGGSRGFVRSMHRGLIAAEAVLVLGVAKDWLWRQVLSSSFSNWTKVGLAMATTVGMFGGFYLVAQRLMARSVSKTHQAAGSLPVFLPTLLVHGALLFVLFLLYARMLGLHVW